jgi:hypothetical protein
MSEKSYWMTVAVLVQEFRSQDIYIAEVERSKMAVACDQKAGPGSPQQSLNLTKTDIHCRMKRKA